MASAPLKAVLIGVGAWGRVLAKAASGSDKIELVGCVGRNPERLATFSRDTGLPARELDAVLTDEAVAAVVLALPNELHREFAERTARQANSKSARVCASAASPAASVQVLESSPGASRRSTT